MKTLKRPRGLADGIMTSLYILAAAPGVALIIKKLFS